MTGLSQEVLRELRGKLAVPRRLNCADFDEIIRQGPAV